MNTSKLKGKPHMHIRRAWDGRKGKFAWVAEERGTTKWPVPKGVPQVERMLAVQYLRQLGDC